MTVTAVKTFRIRGLPNASPYSIDQSINRQLVQ